MRRQEGRIERRGGRNADVLRKHTLSDARWCEKTMSVLRELRREACQERLAHWPQNSVFSPMCDDEYREVFLRSFFAQEERLMPPREKLCEKLISRVPAEAMYLSPAEDTLCKRMLIAPERTVSCDWEDIGAAEALVKRLWCSLTVHKDCATITLAEPVYPLLMSGMLSDDYPKARNALFPFDASLHGLLYLSGFLYAEVPKKHFISENMASHVAIADSLMSRYLRAGFDCLQNMNGEILLMHPGLAEPERLFQSLQGIAMPEMRLTHDRMLGGMNGILPEEIPSAEAMRGALTGAVRPEYDKEEALEDLRMMAKQGATLPEMREVLESMLCVLPTPWMLSALEQLHLQAVRWIGMPSAVLN